MLTYEKVMEVFGEYLEEDTDCEVVSTSRGYVVMIWDTRGKEWVDIKTASTPEALRDILLEDYSGYLAYKMIGGMKRSKPTDQEWQEIMDKCCALWERCQ